MKLSLGKIDHTGSKALKDLVIIAVITVIVFILASVFNVFEILAGLFQKYEKWQVDEIITAFIILSLAFGVFSIRRWGELRAEISRHEKTRRENERLILANQLKSEFLAIMSHELRTPMNAIIGFSELLKQKKAGELNEKQETYLDYIISSGKHLLNLINDVLDMSKIEAGRMELAVERVSVPEAVYEVQTLIKTSAEKRNVILKKEIEPQLEYIEADKRKFKQVLFNLLSNAVKFSKEEGGTVTITAKRTGDMAEFSVSDTGIGVKEENMGKLFTVFQQLDPGITKKYGGTGLGLAITKQLVELHGGTISAVSKYGDGTTFTFALPLKAKLEINR